MSRSLKTNRHVEVFFLPLYYGEKEKKIDGWEVSLKREEGDMERGKEVGAFLYGMEKSLHLCVRGSILCTF